MRIAQNCSIPLLLAFQNGSIGGINLIVILITVCLEADFIYSFSMLIVQLTFIIPDIADSGMFQCNLLCCRCSNIITGGFPRRLRGFLLLLGI